MIIRTTIDGREWLKVISAPRMKVLRIHLFGLTLGFTALLTHLIFAPRAEITFLLLLAWFSIGYLFGFVFAQLNNYFVFLYLQILHPEWMKLWFYYDPNQEVNIIKTPIPERDWDLDTRNLYLKEKFKVFDYQPYPSMRHPYTIVFVANPLIEKAGDEPTPELIEDPIMNNRHLFLKAIERALFNFEFNHEVIGRPDIWSKIRVIAINPAQRPADKRIAPDDVTAALVREFDGVFEQTGTTGSFSTFMLRPTERLVEFARNSLQNSSFSHIEHIDVIFALSASTTHDRSTADPSWFTDENGNTIDDRHKNGQPFTISFDPYCQKRDEQNRDEIIKNECEKSLCDNVPIPNYQYCQPSPDLSRCCGPDYVKKHEFFPRCDGVGVVALSALDVRDRLPLHEFAHAMSSVENGLIVDEYFDYALIREGDNPAYDPFGSKHFFVNRIYRDPKFIRANHPVPVHNIFARYNGYVYESDRQHPSGRQGWFAYFPERREREVRCTMDTAPDVFEFDELIRDFMYDRLWAKVNRDFVVPESVAPSCPPE